MITQEIRDDQNYQNNSPVQKFRETGRTEFPTRNVLMLFALLVVVVAPKKEEESGQKRKQKTKDPHKPAKKIKVDKSNPNWNLKKRIDIVVLEKDLLFETRNEVPMISTAADSHLIR